MIVVTPRLVHYPQDDMTYLTAPELTLYRPSSPLPWLIKSQHAKSMHGVDEVNFWDDVSIHHAADANNPTTLIKTNTLLVHPNKQTAETAELITMVQPNTIIKAIGMHADMNTGNIQLLSNARGEYVPSS
jgi:lipopolysaccharide export system protein LptC